MNPIEKINIEAKPGKSIYLNRYIDNLKLIPNSGSPIIGHQQEDTIVVYQAYRSETAAFAQRHQKLGGNYFSFDRMSWIKPNFLWMMYRCGWASKDLQKNVLAICIRKSFFQKIINQGVMSAFQPDQYESRESWKEALKSSEVRIQWDPDHDPYGDKQDWRAIQLGLRGEILKAFCTTEIVYIQDITDFVRAQKLIVDRKALDELLIPVETVYEPII